MKKRDLPTVVLMPLVALIVSKEIWTSSFFSYYGKEKQMLEDRSFVNFLQKLSCNNPPHMENLTQLHSDYILYSDYIHRNRVA